ncbi:MAG: CCA tRNA nucleotidyltransferase [Acidobacteriota bacterium]|nr:CCA tRNA nucleotidyltransferase [Acidobacteriota bacterium]
MAKLTQNAHFRAALAIARTLKAAGHPAFFAGGCVRDLLLGLSPKDVDVATSATPEEIVALFPKTFAVGAHFGVVLVCVPGGDDRGEAVESAIEVATFRHDGAYSDGRRPDAVRFSHSPEDDVRRRDFTINGMLLDPIAVQAHPDLNDEGNPALLDLVGGRRDLATGTIRAIGDPAVRFAEDKLRMLRAVRFAARLGFSLERQTASAIRRHAAEIHVVSAERVRDELTRILTEGGARRGFELLDELALLPHVLPEIARMKGVAQPPEFHPEGDVWAHTLLLLEKLPPKPSATLAWGALLHDIGKPATFQPPDPAVPGDRIRFNGHVEVGVRIAEVVLERLRFSNDDTTQILSLIKNHMRFGDVLQMKQSTLRRFLRLPHFEEHLALHWLDATSAHGDLRLYHFARAKYEAEEPPELRAAPLLTGRDLIAAGYPPSPQFKPMLTLAEDAQLEGTIHTTAEALLLVAAHFPRPGAA